MGKKVKYDYCVIGTGFAGCLMANRLSKDNTVILVEAGPVNSRYQSSLPCFWANNYLDGKVDWGFETEPEAGMNNRILKIERGKCAGGSSMINDMVYVRPHPADLDKWCDAVGDNTWKYDNVLPFFKKTECHLDRQSDPYHGKEGEVQVRRARKVPEVITKFEKACVEAGFTTTDDTSGGKYEGFTTVDSMVDKSGRRVDAWSAFIEPIKDRPTLTIKTDCLVDSFEIEAKKPVAVWILENGYPKRHKIRKEAIICCGPIESGLVLHRSGYGQKKKLRELGAEYQKELLGIGQNLQDHPRCGIEFLFKPGMTDFEKRQALMKDLKRAPEDMTESDAKKLVEKHGMRSDSSGLWYHGFIKSSPEEPRPDLHLSITLGNCSAANYDTSLMDKDVGAVIVTVLHPKSSGKFVLKTLEPGDKPPITPGLLTDKDNHDINLLRKGLEIARKIISQDSFKECWTTEVRPGAGPITDEYIRNSGGLARNPCGTCAMGKNPKTNKGSLGVVDSHGRVFHMKDCRIADSSIIPVITSCNNHATSLMIAERIADFILNGDEPKVEK